MAIVKAAYKKDLEWAKAGVKSMHSSIMVNGKRRIPTLFSAGGGVERQEVYALMNEAPKGSYFYRFVISPDPVTEDTKRDLFLREVTERTMMSLEKQLFPYPTMQETRYDAGWWELTETDLMVLEERMKHCTPWVAVIHDDTVSKRFVRVVAVVERKLRVPDLQALIRGATEAAKQQRREHDLIFGLREEKKQNKK